MPAPGKLPPLAEDVLRQFGERSRYCSDRRRHNLDADRVDELAGDLIVRVLISGAGGFVGRHLAVAMAGSGHDVVALVRRTRSPFLISKSAFGSRKPISRSETEALPAGPFDAAHSLRRRHPERGTG